MSISTEQAKIISGAVCGTDEGVEEFQAVLDAFTIAKQQRGE